ncbi:vesicle-associated protein 2-2 [Punica granatum]|uniref:Vesicle-associated protein 2-2 n=1 Tax=Punica granatum TaxID=22663 RepID=A0A218W368_PUNGR|nr:vesicle-associated protein 2-2 [Punica granatum]XP_031398127.1 vesicle-associated protein 2-2 [Punica granatum]XP_031398128.1 vesicle-associated protein 2-2 [Punica granatum]XP_031398129.1 vesicle-associated protein 2-2 [Punica granatum]OWM66993.1 hypothetical protein CDL15_Pgr000445 [Punica granatum]
MGTQLLEIQPHELKFVFELKKQSACSIQLVNKTQHHVAFKVKTTSPKKYCVRPNVGIVMPKSTCEFAVTMQAQRSAPTDMMCKDKFLIQSTVVPAGTTEEDITTEVFSKVEGKFIEENKLRVALVSPPESPVLSPINGALKQGVIEAPTLKGHHGLSEVDFIKTQPKVAKAVDPPKVVNDKESPEKDEKIKPAEEVVVMKVAKDVEPYVKDVKLCTKDDVEGKNLVKDIAELKTKLSELESKLGGAEATISKLIEERKMSPQEREILKEDLALLRSRKGNKTVHDGFPLLFVIMVALISVTFGYISR